MISRRQFLKGSGIVSMGLMASTGRIFAPKTAPDSNASSKFGTYSIVAHDPELHAWAVAVTSKFPFSGAVVPYVGIGGAVASQAFTDVNAGMLGLAAEETVEAILATYSPSYQKENKQFGIIDAQGNTAVFTGSSNPAWNGHIEGENFATQGNTLTGPEVLDAVAESFTTSSRDFWFRLLDALKAGEAAGGDRREVGVNAVGNSAAIKIMAPTRSILGDLTLMMDIRVDNAEAPLEELEVLMDLWLSTLSPESISS